jgi:hypothetical protein
MLWEKINRFWKAGLIKITGDRPKTKKRNIFFAIIVDKTLL